MDARSSTSSSSRWPVAALAALLVILTIEALVYQSRGAFLDDVFPVAVRKQQAMTDGQDPEDILIMGDSRYFSIRPDSVEQAFGPDFEARNFTWPFFGVDAYVYTMESYLEYNPPPRIILTSFMPNYISIPTEFLRLGEVQLMADRAFLSLPSYPLFKSLLDDGRWRLAWDLFEYTAMPPSATYRNGIQRALSSILEGEGWPKRPEREASWLEQYEEHGAILLFEDEVNGPNAVQNYIDNYTPLELFEDPEVLSIFEEFLEIADQNDVPVVLVNTPLPNVVVDYYEEKGILEAYRGHIAAFQKRHENLYIVEPLIRRFPNDHLGDLGHLNRAGDERFHEIFPAVLEKEAPEILRLAKELRARKNGRENQAP